MNNTTTIFSIHLLNKEYVSLYLVFLKRNMIITFTLEQSDRLPDPKNTNYTASAHHCYVLMICFIQLKVYYL